MDLHMSRINNDTKELLITLAAHPAPFEGLSPEDISAFFVEQPIAPPERAPFQGFTPEEIEALFADATHAGMVDSHD